MIPQPVFQPFLVLPQAPSLGFTTGYPVQTQLLVQVIAQKPGYSLHKLAVQIYLLQQLGLDNADLRKAADQLYKKSSGSENAFFAYLTMEPRKEVADIILRHCPPKLDTNESPRPSRHQWIWERNEQSEKGELWKFRSYWDCIFAAKLLVKKGEDAPQILLEMQRAQTEAVHTPFTHVCSGFKSEISANAHTRKQR